MTPRRLPHLLVALLILGGGAVVTGSCSPERLRPGPPSLVLEFPGGTSVFSPDTIVVEVHAMDPNGLDTVSIALRSVTITIDAFTRVELDDFVIFEIGDSIPDGTILTVFGTAADLTGQLTQTQHALEVVPRENTP